MLEVENISVGYGACEVVQNLSFTVREGQITAVLGANGAGKTTLIKSLNGAAPILKGEIRLDGKVLREFSRREIAQRVAVVAQETETKFPITVLEFVLAGRFVHGGVFGWETERDLDIAMGALEKCDLKKFEDRLMNQLSGGERQRVVLARALATEAEILLLDEPTANLDPAHQAQMFGLVRRKCDRDGGAAVVITHDLNLAAEFADEIILLKKGRLAAKGSPESVLNAKTLREVFEIEVLLDRNPASGKPRVTTIYRS